MVSRAISLFGTALAYIVAGIPALIGIGFVARYAFITSDTPADGVATAFLFGMVAAGAFAGPAIAVAVRNRGRKTAAIIWWALATLAILGNWSHTLSAIAHRGAGRDAQAGQPPRQRRNAHLAARRAEQHHRAGVDQPVHRQRHQPAYPARLAVRPHQGIGVFVGRDRGHRRDADHGARSRPPDNLAAGHRAPPAASKKNSEVRRHWYFGALGPRTRRDHDLTCGYVIGQHFATVR